MYTGTLQQSRAAHHLLNSMQRHLMHCLSYWHRPLETTACRLDRHRRSVSRAVTTHLLTSSTSLSDGHRRRNRLPPGLSSRHSLLVLNVNTTVRKQLTHVLWTKRQIPPSDTNKRHLLRVPSTSICTALQLLARICCTNILHHITITGLTA